MLPLQQKNLTFDQQIFENMTSVQRKFLFKELYNHLNFQDRATLFVENPEKVLGWVGVTPPPTAMHIQPVFNINVKSGCCVDKKAELVRTTRSSNRNFLMDWLCRLYAIDSRQAIKNLFFRGCTCVHHIYIYKCLEDAFLCTHVNKNVGDGAFARKQVQEGEIFLLSCIILDDIFSSSTEFSTYCRKYAKEVADDFFLVSQNGMYKALLPTGVGLCINDARGLGSVNAKVYNDDILRCSTHPFHVWMLIQATKRIPVNEQLLINYGAGYWVKFR